MRVSITYQGGGDLAVQAEITLPTKRPLEFSSMMCPGVKANKTVANTVSFIAQCYMK